MRRASLSLGMEGKRWCSILMEGGREGGREGRRKGSAIS
jgi:hypothetical protein